MNKIIKAVTIIFAVAPVLAFAQPSTMSDLLDRLCLVVGWLFGLLVFLSIVMVLYAAFLYLTAAGDPEKVKKANATILYAAIAIAVALLARYLPDIVASLIGSQTTGPGGYGNNWRGCR